MAAMSAQNAIAIEEIALPPEYVVVGVDLGMTCTGVAICPSDRNPPIAPVVIQRWPPNDMVIANKVPTTIAYRAGRSRICSWGFACPSPGNIGYGMDVVESFKFFLDQDALEGSPRGQPPDIGDVRKWFKDFLYALHDHIVAYLTGPAWLLDWHSTKVEYVFGLPTLWKERDELIREFRDIVGQAGFVKSMNCSVSFGLTEAEASAVYTAKSLEHKYKQGDVILVCDAGGGTTDVCVLKVLHTQGEIVELEALDEPRALYAGSTQIDDAFEKYAEECLATFRLSHPQLPEHVAREMARGPFQKIKLAFGTATTAPVENIPVPDLPNAKIQLRGDKIKAMFDEQIQKIVELIDNELEFLRGKLRESKVLYLVLSGGLGSSKYVQTEMEDRYRPKGISVLYPDDPREPPLAVCKGLVIDLMQRIGHGTSVLPTRLSGTSYGILCSDRRDKIRHTGQPTVQNQLDGNKYVVNQIDWFIRKGETIRRDRPIRLKYSRLLGLNNPDKNWSAKVVRSRLEQDCLPEYLSRDDPEVEVICQMFSDLGPDTFLRPNSAGVTAKRKYVVGKKFLHVEYEVFVFIEQETLRFETRMCGGETDKLHPLEVQWISYATEDDQQFTEMIDEYREFQNGLFRHLKG